MNTDNNDSRLLDSSMDNHIVIKTSDFQWCKNGYVNVLFGGELYRNCGVSNYRGKDFVVITTHGKVYNLILKGGGKKKLKS